MKQNSYLLSKLLPVRWFKIQDRAWNHPQVKAFRESTVRFQVVHAGRRSFKTEIAKRRLVREVLDNAYQRYFFGGPTRDQVKRIGWKDLKNLIPKWAILDVSETELRIELVNHAELHCIGFDKPERFEGTVWHGGVLTEFPHFKDTAWDENIAPALRDVGGWAIIEGVPEGRNHYFELSEYAKHSGDLEWVDYCWFTAEVRDPAEVEKEKARLDERTFRQEWEGSFESYEGRAFCYYDPQTHRKPCAFNAAYPLDIMCDFNLDPCIWVLGQDIGGKLYGLDEIKQRQTDIYKMCVELKRRVSEQYRNVRLKFYGDYQHGKARSLSAIASSWQIIRSEFPGAEFRYRPNPLILDGVNAVNSKHRNMAGQVMFQLDPKCVESHKDFDQVSLQDIIDRKEGKERGHASSCWRYRIHYDYPVKKYPEWRAA